MTIATLTKKTFNLVAFGAEIQSIIVMVGHGSTQAGMVLAR